MKLDWINNVLNDKKLIRNIITGAVWVTVFALGLIYFFFISNFDWRNFKWESVTILTVLFAVSIYSLRMDARYRGYDDEYENNEELKTAHKEIIDNRIPIAKVDTALIFLNDYNETQRVLANKQKTEKKINDIQDKIGKRIRKNRNITELQKEVKSLQATPLHNSRFDPIRMSDIINVYSERNGQSYIDRNAIHRDSRNVGNKRAFVSIFARSVVVGSIGLGFVMTDDVRTMLSYFLLLTTMGIWTYTRNYALVRLDTSTIHLDKQRNRLNVMQQMNAWLKGQTDEV